MERQMENGDCSRTVPEWSQLRGPSLPPSLLAFPPIALHCCCAVPGGQSPKKCA